MTSPASIKHRTSDVMVKQLYIRKNALIFEIGVRVKITINHRKTLSNQRVVLQQSNNKVFVYHKVKRVSKIEFFDRFVIDDITSQVEE